jgi:hypothetical protein
VWIDPDSKTVEVVSPNRQVRYFSESESVAIEELPGFAMKLFPL